MQHKPVLKWVGGKYRLLKHIYSIFPVESEKRWVEPFLGSGSVFLNTTASNYAISDVNPDLINFYSCLKKDKELFIRESRVLFKTCNDVDSYEKLRLTFNTSTDIFQKSIIFLYLNRHGYNGLCRYNQKKGFFNAPYGKYEKPYFPENEIRYLCFKMAGLSVDKKSFETVIPTCGKGDQIYCDPPYIPLKNDGFTKYTQNGFTLEQHTLLADLLVEAHSKGAKVAISNTDNSVSRELYAKRNFIIKTLPVYRGISGKGTSRVKTTEILAILT